MDALELIVDEAHPANAGRFFQLGIDLLALLDELTDVPVSWRVNDLRIGSAVASVAAPDSNPNEAHWLRATVDSLAAVSGGSLLPERWTPDTVKVAHQLVGDGQPFADEEEWTAPRLVLVRDGLALDKGVALTPELGQRLADLKPFERSMPGSARGTLVGLNVSHGNRASLRTAHGHIVRITFASALRIDLKEAMLQQVEITGEVRQDGEGRIFHIRADGVNVLSEPELRWSVLFGIDPNFTGGVPTDGWLETSRGQA